MAHYSGEEDQRNIVIDKVKEKAKQKALKKGAKALRKATKVAIKVAVKVVATAIKMIVSFISSISLPYLLVAILVIFSIFIIYIATTLIFSEETLNGEAGKLQEYIQEQADATVDMSRPEQIPYKVPEELIISVMQLYESEGNGKTSKEAIEIIADALKPIFEYTTKTGYTEIETTTCDDGNCTTQYDKEEFEVTLLTHVTAWNGEMIAEVKPTKSKWTTTSHSSSYTTGEGENQETHTITTTTKKRTHSFVTEETFTEDYTHYETVLMGDPFNYGDDDLAIIEILYQSTGGIMNYTDMKQGMSLGDTGLYMNVIPGSGVPAEYMQYYLAAQQKYGVDWFYIAAIHYVETKFSTIQPMVSSVGAEGHTQFMRCTWHGWSYPGCNGSNGHVEMSKHDLYNVSVIKKYGGYGVDADGNGEASPWDIKDALFTTAYYLQKNGFKNNASHSIWQYNHSEQYVNNVMAKAKEFKESAFIGSGGVKNSAGFISPVPPGTGYVSSGFGNRIIGGHSEMHYGMDIARVDKSKPGPPLYAIANGKVTHVENKCSKAGNLYSNCGWGWGNHVRILFEVEGGKYEAVYGHMNQVNVSKGQIVQQGQLIGKMGTSGRSTGIHLHIELHRNSFQFGYPNIVNPQLLIPVN